MSKKVSIIVEFIIDTPDVEEAVTELEIALPSLGDDLEGSIISDATYEVLVAAQTNEE